MFIEDMRERFILARWSYSLGEPIISDIEYDKLEKEYRDKYTDDIYSKQSWSMDECPVDLLKKYNRMEWKVDKVFGYMAESIASVNNKEDVYEQFHTLQSRSRVSFKIDGWNTRVSYYNGRIVKINSRGRSGNNLVYNSIVSLFPQKIPIKGRVAITGELNIPKDKWSVYKGITGNSDQRASVRTALSRGDIEYLSFLAFDIYSEEPLPSNDKYEVLKSLGFTSPMFRWVDDYKSLRKVIDIMSAMDKYYNYLTDGLVIENENYQLAIRIGGWQEELHKSYIMGYEESQGMYGFAMEVLMKPVIVGGRKCSRVSVTNCAIIEENNLRIGYPIVFNIRSAANNVIDVEHTRLMQRRWNDKLDEYKELVDSENEVS